MKSVFLMAQLSTLHQQVMVLAAQIEALLGECDEGSACEHENKVNAATMGWERWSCPDCGVSVERPLAVTPAADGDGA